MPVSGASTPISASTVSPAIARWPSSTRGAVPGGQIDVDPAAEADQADALAGLDHVAFA